MKTATKIHKNKATKNHQFIAFQASFIFHLKTNFKVFKLNPYNESINLSYIQVIKAIVHPLTHGITSQVHINTHFTKVIILSKYFFITKNKKIKR